MEYICTSEDIINTGINIDTVRESKLNSHNIYKDSESIHLNRFNFTGIEFNPTSIKELIANMVVINIDEHVIICAPVTPIFLPKNPAINEPNKGNNIIVKYINFL